MYKVKSSLCFGAGENSISESSLCFSSSKSVLSEYRWLIFVDSRGLEGDCQIGSTWLFKFCLDLEKKGESYLAVSRPKNITIFATLINFIELNKISYENLVTNLGFVDCTPKKECFIDDIKSQLGVYFSPGLEVSVFPEYACSDGGTSNLYSLIYDKNYLNELSVLLLKSFTKILLINTCLIPLEIVFGRKRPLSFYSQLNVTNELLQKLGSLLDSDIIDVNRFSDSLVTFDAVHFTESGHRIMYEEVSKFIKGQYFE